MNDSSDNVKILILLFQRKAVSDIVVKGVF